jgi:osmotically-inducible protein OsmY
MQFSNSKWLVLAGIGLLLAGCNSEDASNLTHDVSRIAQDTTKAAGNAQLAARVNSVLVQRKGIDMRGLHVEVDHGVVTIGGHVRNTHEKNLVLQTVRDTRGVDKVLDKLRIAP